MKSSQSPVSSPQHRSCEARPRGSMEIPIRPWEWLSSGNWQLATGNSLEKRNPADCGSPPGQFAGSNASGLFAQRGRGWWQARCANPERRRGGAHSSLLPICHGSFHGDLEKQARCQPHSAAHSPRPEPVLAHSPPNLRPFHDTLSIFGQTLAARSRPHARSARGNTFRTSTCSIWPRVTPIWLLSFSSRHRASPVISPRSSAR